jgi:hypothetical protein
MMPLEYPIGGSPGFGVTHYSALQGRRLYGYSNLSESKAGTDLLNPGDVLVVISVAYAPRNTFVDQMEERAKQKLSSRNPYLPG